MPGGITLAQAQTELANATAAYNKALQEQAYAVTGALRGGGRSVTRAELQQLQNAVTYWDTKVAQLTRGGMRVRRGVAL